MVYKTRRHSGRSSLHKYFPQSFAKTMMSSILESNRTPSFTILQHIPNSLSTMLRFAWPSSPATTPKAQQIVQNPFESTNIIPSDTKQPPQISKNITGESTPMALSPAAPGIQPLGLPTTQLSIHPPEFSLK